MKEICQSFSLSNHLSVHYKKSSAEYRARILFTKSAICRDNILFRILRPAFSWLNVNKTTLKTIYPKFVLNFNFFGVHQSALRVPPVVLRTILLKSHIYNVSDCDVDQRHGWLHSNGSELKATPRISYLNRLQRPVHWWNVLLTIGRVFVASII